MGGEGCVKRLLVLLTVNDRTGDLNEDGSNADWLSSYLRWRVLTCVNVR